MAEFKFNPVKWSKNVQKTGEILCVNNHFFIYKKSGVFERLDDFEFYRIVMELLDTNYKERWAKEIKHCVAVDCSKRAEEINKDKNMINIKNGMFCLEEMKRFDHNKKYLSTIQLPVEYREDSKCPLWIKTLDEIFIGKKWKIDLLQEFMGYCLTSDISHQKALMNVGQGANGKSLIFRIHEKILGPQNVSSISMSGLEKNHYLAELFGKLVNLSIESETDIKINDAVFKALVGGDSITADEKYGKPFSFNPFCKLIFSMNTLPFVSDKTSAFYRRVLIINYEREFSREEQNLGLYKDLCEELDGIFLWMIQGLQRLNKNGHFTEDKEMTDIIEDYKLDNNPPLGFIEENLSVHKINTIPKKEIYSKYTAWSKENGYKAVSDKNLTKTIRKYFTNGVVEDRTGTTRRWKGLIWKDQMEKQEVAQWEE